MDRSELDLDWGRWRRQPETQAFLRDLLDHFQGVRHWATTSSPNLPILQGQAQVLDYVMKEIRSNDER